MRTTRLISNFIPTSLDVNGKSTYVMRHSFWFGMWLYSNQFKNDADNTDRNHSRDLVAFSQGCKESKMKIMYVPKFESLDKI